MSEKNFNSFLKPNPRASIPPVCYKCGKEVRNNNFDTKNEFTKCMSSPPWNSGWEGKCEHCGYDYNIHYSQIVSASDFSLIKRETSVAISQMKHMDSLDTFVILSGVEMEITETHQFNSDTPTAINRKIFISTNELKYLIAALKNSPILAQYDWDVDCT
jgi:hypothetical protein